jgi:hypothetical protein
MKALPLRVVERLAEYRDPNRRRRLRHFHPMVFSEIRHMLDDPYDPIAILILVSMIRDDAPWLYELAMEVYRAIKSEDAEAIEREVRRFRRISESIIHGPLMEAFIGFDDKDIYMLIRELPGQIEGLINQMLKEKKLRPQHRMSKNLPEQPDKRDTL